MVRLGGIQLWHLNCLWDITLVYHGIKCSGRHGVGIVALVISIFMF